MENVFDANKTYRLFDILDRNGRTKKVGFPNGQEQHRRWVGLYTNHVAFRPLAGYSDNDCLFVWFCADAEGNQLFRHLRTSPVQEIQAGHGVIAVRTINSIYLFREAAFPEPPLQEAIHLVELWFGRGDYLFDKGVHYDEEGTAHILQCAPHLGTIQDSYLICHREDLHITVARYFIGYHRVIWYNTLQGQQAYTTPMLIHNTSDTPLMIRYSFSNEEYEILPGEERLIQPPKKEV